MMETKPFEIFNNDWALLTAGPLSKHNSMTNSWREMGTLWSKKVVTVYVKPIRYTYEFMEENDYFVLSFFDNQYKKSLALMGSKSGRDIDKDKEANLTPVEHNGVTIYKEARMTIILKKIYHADLIKDNVPIEALETYYLKEKPHRMYIGEVVEIL